MRKRLICILLTIIIFILASFEAAAFSSYNASDIENCNRIYVDSSSYGGFVYGFSGKTMYSSMLIPNHNNRIVNAPYNIKSVCQSGELSCAMYICDNKTNKYGITSINMNTGKIADYTFVGVDDASSKMFSLSENYAYFVRSDATYSYVAVYGVDGSLKKKCHFKDNIYLLFNNNSVTYAMLYDGRIYRFSGTGYTQVAKLDKGENAFSAGTGYICTESGMLVSLENGSILNVTGYSKNRVAAANDGVYTMSGNKLVFRKSGSSERYIELSSSVRCIVVYGGRIATLNYGYDYNDISDSELKSSSYQQSSNSADNSSSSKSINQSSNVNLPNEYRIEQGKYILGVAPSTSVTDFKNKFSDSTAVYDSDGSAVTSGKMKTGYTVNIGSNSYTISVYGDLTGEGNVKSNDTNLLMNYFVGAQELSELQLLSADYDLNGEVDNRDLVLIARHGN